MQPAAIVLEKSTCSPGREKLGTVLMYVAPGSQVTNFSDETIFILTDSFYDYIFEKAGSVWNWKDGAFRESFAADGELLGS